MRPVLIFLAISLYGSACLAQRDTSNTTTQAPVQRRVFIPGVNTPISGGGMTAQVPVAQPVQNDGDKRKTQPPSDPRAFGVAIPLEKGKTKRDTLRN